MRHDSRRLQVDIDPRLVCFIQRNTGSTKHWLIERLSSGEEGIKASSIESSPSLPSRRLHCMNQPSLNLITARKAFPIQALLGCGELSPTPDEYFFEFFFFMVLRRAVLRLGEMHRPNPLGAESHERLDPDILFRRNDRRKARGSQVFIVLLEYAPQEQVLHVFRTGRLGRSGSVAALRGLPQSGLPQGPRVRRVVVDAAHLLLPQRPGLGGGEREGLVTAPIPTAIGRRVRVALGRMVPAERLVAADGGGHAALSSYAWYGLICTAAS